MNERNGQGGREGGCYVQVPVSRQKTNPFKSISSLATRPTDTRISSIRSSYDHMYLKNFVETGNGSQPWWWKAAVTTQANTDIPINKGILFNNEVKVF